MLDIRLIRENPAKVKELLLRKEYDASETVDKILELDQQRRDLIREEPVKGNGPLIGTEFLDVTGLHIADNLQTHRLKVIVITCQLQTGTGHILHRQADLFIIAGLIDHLKVEFTYQLC